MNKLSKTLLFLFLIFATTFIQCQDNSKFINALKAELQKISQLLPAKYEYLIKNLSASTDFIVDAFRKTELEGQLKFEYNLPQEVVDRFKGIAFSQSVAMQSFNLIVQKNRGTLEEYIGAAYNENDIVKVGYIKSVATGDLLLQFDKIQNNYIVRGYTAQEILIITNALRATAFTQIEMKVNDVQNDFQYALLEGYQVLSPDKSHNLIMQLDGNLVIYEVSTQNPIWSTSTQYSSLYMPYSLSITINGSLQVRDPYDVLWNAPLYARGPGPYKLELMNNGNLAFFDRNYQPLWDSKSRFNRRSFVLPENSYMFSPNGQYFVVVQSDCNFVVYSSILKNGNDENKAVWASLTAYRGAGPFYLAVEADGNMYLRGGDDGPLVQTRTRGKGTPPHRLELSNEGNLELKDYYGSVVWSSKGGSLYGPYGNSN